MFYYIFLLIISGVGDTYFEYSGNLRGFRKGYGHDVLYYRKINWGTKLGA